MYTFGHLYACLGRKRFWLILGDYGQQGVEVVLTLSKLQGKFPGAETVKKAPKGDVQIVGFKFMPATITAQAGKPLKWMNADDSPHWIAISGSPQRTEMLLRGQTGSITFDKPGSFGYICGLHPSMKGTIEVK